MKILKRLLGFLLFLVIGGLIVGFFSPKNIYVERGIEIDARPEIVYNQVNNLENYNNWNPWNDRDPNIEIEYSQQKEGKGAQFYWNSEKRNVGSGSLSITESIPYESLENELNFGDRGMGYSKWAFVEIEEGTKTTWGMQAEIGNNPVGRLMGLIMRSSIKRNFDKGLGKLKEVAESIKAPLLDIEETEVPSMNIISLRLSPMPADDEEAIFDATSEAFQKIDKYMSRKKIEAQGFPLCIYHKLDKEQVEFTCGIPVKKGTRVSGDFKLTTLEGSAYTCMHKGDYSNLPETYEGIEMWLADQGKAPQGLIWEEYITDPELEENPENWETKIYYMME